MPEFQQNPYGWQDYHDEQLKHYGLKRDTGTASSRSGQPSSQPNFQRNEATGMPVPIARPRRKPVAGSTTPTTPLSLSPAPASPRTQSPDGTRLIYTRADGRFDPSTIRTERSKYTPPSSPVDSPSRPSSSSSSRPALKRTDSNSSKKSWRLRRDSAGEAVRRLSNSFKDKVGIITMDRNERVRFMRDKNAANVAPELHSQPRAGRRNSSVSKTEQLALNISKAVDPIKARGRKGSNDSDMSMGMTDNAPAGMMDPCVRCYRPIVDFATLGLCQKCYKELKTGGRPTGKDEELDPNEVDPDSPGAGYMKLPIARKIVRVRHTIYADPGNPFENEVEDPQQMNGKDTLDDEHPLLPSLSRRAGMHLSEGPPVCTPDIWNASTAVVAPSQAELILHPASKPFDDRPKSTESQVTDRHDSGYIAPRSFWRIDDARAPDHVSARAGTEDVRDTQFYGFYDDIMQDYR